MSNHGEIVLNVPTYPRRLVDSNDVLEAAYAVLESANPGERAHPVALKVFGALVGESDPERAWAFATYMVRADRGQPIL